MGIAATCPTTDCTPDALLAAADQALYQAKNQGRNQYVIATKNTPNSSEEAVLPSSEPQDASLLHSI
jgi:predicted signal transduction protein with EAL and GGDEF domain